MRTNIFYTQSPLDIYKERMERMKLVTIAPFIFIIGLTVVYASVLFIDKHQVYNFKRITTAFLLSLGWFLVTGFLIRQRIIKLLLGNTSTWFRFLFDLPFLLICLFWIVYCFHSVNVFEYPFFVTFYVLSVYSASTMIKIPAYTLATNGIGILLILYFASNKIQWFSQEGFFNKKDILENFAALYVGLYFTEIQLIFIYIINMIMKFVKFVSSTLLEEP